MASETSSDDSVTVLTSSLAEDVAFAPVLERYRLRLNGRISQIRSAFEAAALDDLRFQLHQVTGAAGSYGYAPISEAARQCERLLETGSSVAEIKEPLNELLRLMKAAALPEEGAIP